MSFADEIGARTLWAEARGELPEGQRAVAHVLWNRLRSGRWGKTMASVCLSPLQFSCWNTNDPNRQSLARLSDDDPMLRRLAAMLASAETEPDPTGGAMYYYAPGIVAEPSWAKKMVSCGKIGRQLFFREAGA